MKNYAMPGQRCEKEAGILERFRKQERILRAGIGAAAGVILALMIGVWVNQELAFGAVTVSGRGGKSDSRRDSDRGGSQYSREIQIEREASTAEAVQTEGERGSRGSRAASGRK